MFSQVSKFILTVTVLLLDIEVHCLLKKFITVPTTSLPACFVNLKESTCEARKNVSKSLFILEIIKFYLFRYSNVMASSNAEA